MYPLFIDRIYSADPSLVGVLFPSSEYDHVEFDQAFKNRIEILISELTAEHVLLNRSTLAEKRVSAQIRTDVSYTRCGKRSTVSTNRRVGDVLGHNVFACGQIYGDLSIAYFKKDKELQRIYRAAELADYQSTTTKQ
jgi:hypothetical protein